MSVGDENAGQCLHCDEGFQTGEDKVWIWESHNPGVDRERGPFHMECAAETVAEEPDRWSIDEPGTPVYEGKRRSREAQAQHEYEWEFGSSYRGKRHSR